MIVADTGGVIALIDRRDPSHEILRARFEADLGEWVLPWAILPEVDYIVGRELGSRVAADFRADVAEGLFQIDWNGGADLTRAGELDARYAALELGLVDSIVMAMAERLHARAIVTLDLRDFGQVELVGRPELWPRDLS